MNLPPSCSPPLWAGHTCCLVTPKSRRPLGVGVQPSLPPGLRLRGPRAGLAEIHHGLLPFPMRWEAVPGRDLVRTAAPRTGSSMGGRWPGSHQCPARPEMLHRGPGVGGPEPQAQLVGKVPVVPCRKAPKQIWGRVVPRTLLLLRVSSREGDTMTCDGASVSQCTIASALAGLLVGAVEHLPSPSTCCLPRCSRRPALPLPSELGGRDVPAPWHQSHGAGDSWRPTPSPAQPGPALARSEVLSPPNGGGLSGVQVHCHLSPGRRVTSHSRCASPPRSFSPDTRLPRSLPALYARCLPLLLLSLSP